MAFGDLAMGNRRCSRRSSGLLGWRYAQLRIEPLEDRRLLSGSSNALFSATGDNPVVIVVAPESNGSTVSWTPIAELSAVGFPVDGSPVITFDGNHVTIAPDQAANDGEKANISTPASDARVSIGQATVEFTLPAGSAGPLIVDDLKPDLTAQDSLSNAIIPGEGPGNAGLGSDFNQPVMDGDGIIIVNADTDNPAQSISASNATMIQDGVVFQNASSPASAATTPAASASPSGTDQAVLPTSNETPSAPTQVARADQKSSTSSPDAPTASAALNLVVDDLSGDSTSSIHASGQLSTPAAAVSIPASQAVQTASPAVQGTTTTNRPATAEDPLHLLPGPGSAPAKGTPSDSSMPPTTGPFDGPEMLPATDVQAADAPAEANVPSPAAPGAVIAQRQPALLASLPLDLSAVDRALDNLLREVDELGEGLANWLGIPSLPRGLAGAALLAVAASIAGHQLRQARRRRTLQEERDAALLSRIFTSW